MTATSTPTAADLFADYTSLGGTKTLKSFKSKAAIQAAIDELLEAAQAEEIAEATGEQPDLDAMRSDAADADTLSAAIEETEAQRNAALLDTILGSEEPTSAYTDAMHREDDPSTDEPVDEEQDADDEPATDDGTVYGMITEKLNKMQRARLRKALGGKLSDGRWTTVKIPVSILEKAKVAYKIVD